MYTDPTKTILVDADGVLLDWMYAFHSWMARHGYEIADPDDYKVSNMYNLETAEGNRLVRMFNESSAIRRVPPLRDAIKYIRKLHEEYGYVFHVISSISDDQYSQHLRAKNLRELFGDTVFERYVFLDTGADKDEALEPYKNSECIWVEDKPENADLGASLGLDAILMAHSHNIGYTGPAKRVSNWKEIYKYIVD